MVAFSRAVGVSMPAKIVAMFALGATMLMLYPAETALDVDLLGQPLTFFVIAAAAVGCELIVFNRRGSLV